MEQDRSLHELLHQLRIAVGDHWGRLCHLDRLHNQYSTLLRTCQIFHNTVQVAPKMPKNRRARSAKHTTYKYNLYQASGTFVSMSLARSLARDDTSAWFREVQKRELGFRQLRYTRDGVVTLRIRGLHTLGCEQRSAREHEPKSSKDFAANSDDNGCKYTIQCEVSIQTVTRGTLLG